MTEHDFEPVPGLPAPLPPGEKVLWQGAPKWQALARHAFHVRKVAIYFAIIAVWRIVTQLSDGNSVMDALTAALWTVTLGFPCVMLLTLFAWASARSTLYTITNRRIVMRFGVALPMSINVPFAVIESASSRQDADGSGDIAMLLAPSQKIAYAALWPHARRWHFSRPQPLLRTIPEVAKVASMLTSAIAKASNDSVNVPEIRIAARVTSAHAPEAPRSLAGVAS